MIVCKSLELPGRRCWSVKKEKQLERADGPLELERGKPPRQGALLGPTRLLLSQAGACCFLSERPPLDPNKNNLQMVLLSPKAT